MRYQRAAQSRDQEIAELPIGVGVTETPTHDQPLTV
jgi:hypothetical protein